MTRLEAMQYLSASISEYLGAGHAITFELDVPNSITMLIKPDARVEFSTRLILFDDGTWKVIRE